ncbi:hypothetical protein F4774DRAFT_41876 [Daldinia eschscholtzii]|nr:hypothetical protein F4774DRAFT_41876 [Daldinia eschscholtzii]
MVSFRGDLKSWRGGGHIFALFGIPASNSSSDRAVAGRARQTYTNSTRPVLRVESTSYDSEGDNGSVRSGSSAASEASVTEEVVVRLTRRKHGSAKHLPAKKHPLSREVSGSDADDDDSDSEEVPEKKHAQGKKQPSTKRIAPSHQTSESESEEDSEDEEVAPRRRATIQKQKQRQETADVSDSSDGDSGTLVDSETDEESSESEEEVVVPNRSRDKKSAPIRRQVRSKKASNAAEHSPSESESDSTEESDADAEVEASDSSESESDTGGEESEEEPDEESEEESEEDSEESAKETEEQARKKSEEKSNTSEKGSDKEVAVTKTQASAKQLTKAVSPPESDSDSSESEPDSKAGSSRPKETAAAAQPSKVQEDIRMRKYRVRNWGIHEDGPLCYMKAKGCLSQQIAQKLKRDKKEVQVRIQEIMELAEENGSTINHLGEVFGAFIINEMKKDKEAQKPKPQPKHPALVESVANDSSDEEPKEKGKGKQNSKTSSTTKSPIDSASSASSYKPANCSSSSSSTASCPSISGATTATLPPVCVPEPDRIDLLRALSRIYPNKKIFYPDSTFGTQECHALAVCEACYRGQRLNSIHSDFEKLTGRRVDIEVLKAKLAQATDPYDGVAVNWGGICHR